jgi:hypothetical protein
MRLIRRNTNTRIEDPSTSLETVINVQRNVGEAVQPSMKYLIRRFKTLQANSAFRHTPLSVTVVTWIRRRSCGSSIFNTRNGKALDTRIPIKTRHPRMQVRCNPHDGLGCTDLMPEPTQFSHAMYGGEGERIGRASGCHSCKTPEATLCIQEPSIIFGFSLPLNFASPMNPTAVSMCGHRAYE